MPKPSEETQLALVVKDVGYLRKAVDDLKDDVKMWKNDFVTKSEFKPYKLVVYGMVVAILGYFFKEVIIK